MEPKPYVYVNKVFRMQPQCYLLLFFFPDSRMVEYKICADNYEPDSHDGIVFVSQHDENGVKFEQKA